MSNKPDLSLLARDWKGSYVPRKDVAKFSSGILHPRNMSNLDSAGKGPKGRFLIGRTVVYPKDELIKWMEERGRNVEVE